VFPRGRRAGCATAVSGCPTEIPKSNVRFAAGIIGSTTACAGSLSPWPRFTALLSVYRPA